jgi:hypothetical protein
MLILEEFLSSKSPLSEFTALQLVELCLSEDAVKPYANLLFSSFYMGIDAILKEEKIKVILGGPKLATEYIGAILEAVIPRKGEPRGSLSREILRDIHRKALQHPNLERETFEKYIYSLIGDKKFLPTNIKELFYRAIHTYPIASDYLLSISSHPDATIRSFIYNHPLCPKTALVAGALRGDTHKPIPLEFYMA